MKAVVWTPRWRSGRALRDAIRAGRGVSLTPPKDRPGSRPGYPLRSLSGSRAAFHVIFQSLNVVTARNNDCYEVRNCTGPKRPATVQHAMSAARRFLARSVPAPSPLKSRLFSPINSLPNSRHHAAVITRVYDFFLHDRGRISVGESVCSSNRRPRRAGRQSADTYAGPDAPLFWRIRANVSRTA